MATPRSSQTHDKRVQKIAEDAASKIAADSPLEEEVVVVVEELPPGQSVRAQRGAARTPRPTARRAWCRWWRKARSSSPTRSAAGST